MTLSSDSWDEMRPEQLPDEPLLTDVLDELRSWGAEPAPVPTAALASLLGDSAPTTAAPPSPAPVPSQRRRKMPVAQLLTGLAAKLAGLGFAAKAAVGLGVASAAVTTAGVTGVLPGPAQNAVETVVEAVSPLQLSDPTGSSTTSTTLANRGVSGAVGLDEDEGEGDEVDGTRTANHGACVSAVARDDSLTSRDHGKVVSAVAQSDCGKEDKGGATSSTSSPSTTSTSIAGDEPSNRGGGNANGRSGNSGASANGGPGNSGNAGNSGNSGSGGGNSGSGGGNSGSGSGSGRS